MVILIKILADFFEKCRLTIMTDFSSADTIWMRRALELARRGEGLVEPNPMVGCVIVRDGVVLGEGFHTAFGAAHAEIEALQNSLQNSLRTSLHVSRGDIAGATFYVTLEPCTHHGKTPPCCEAIISAKPQRVVIAMQDPFPAVAGRGIETLEQAGISVTVGVEEMAARELLAPYLMREMHERPWIIAKYAMTLDGKIASITGSSRWISSEESRQRVMKLRGRVDAILIGSETARRDNPLLTVRGEVVSARTPMRIVLDSHAAISPQSQLVQTAREVPLLIVASKNAPQENIGFLQANGVEVFIAPDESNSHQNSARKIILDSLLKNLAARGVTNLLVEGGSRVLGAFFDARLIDEVYAFIAPKLIGGAAATSPIAGTGINEMNHALTFSSTTWISSGDDMLLHGRVAR